MSLNWKEIDLVLSEIDPAGAHIQGIIQSGYDSICLDIYRPGRAQRLFISIASGGCRLHITEKTIPRPKKALRFQEFLKARILGMRIAEAVQLGSERVVRLRLERQEESLGPKRIILYTFSLHQCKA